MKVVLGLFVFSLIAGILVFVHYGLPAYADLKAHWPSHDPTAWIDFPPWTALLAFGINCHDRLCGLFCHSCFRLHPNSQKARFTI
jgi:hypothetical protein